MTDEEIKLRCIEMVITLYNKSLSCRNVEYASDIKSIVNIGDIFFETVYPYLKEGKLPKEDNS